MSTRPAGDGKLTTPETAGTSSFDALPDIGLGQDTHVQPGPGSIATPRHRAAQSEPRVTLEFELAPGDVTRLLRCRALQHARVGRLRTTAVHDVWHDTPNSDLALGGYTLKQHGATWQLARLVPNGVTDWPPAAPAPVLAEAQDLSVLDRAAINPARAAGLAPVAAFTGKRRNMNLSLGGQSAGLSVLDGNLRGVAADRPACRVTLSGPLPCLAAMADSLLEIVHLDVPRAGLAAEAIAVAQGRAPAARHVGTPRTDGSQDVDAAFTQILGHLADVILYWAPLAEAGDTPEPVHQMRVALRRLRSSLSVFRPACGCPALDQVAPQVAALARLLGTARDWDVFLSGTGQALQTAMAGDKRITALLTAGARRQSAAYTSLRAFMADRAWGRLQMTLALLPVQRPWRDGATADRAALFGAPLPPYAARMLEKRLRHVLAPGEDLSAMPAEGLHDIRKQAKRLRYAAEFFTPLFPGKSVKRYLERLENLQEQLGLVNDACVAAALMADIGGGADRAFAAGAVRGFVVSGSAEALGRVNKVWGKFYRQAPFWD